MIDEELYTWSRAPNSWSSFIEEDPQVAVRIEGLLYRATALKVDDDPLLARVNEDRAGEKEAVGISFHPRLEKWPFKKKSWTCQLFLVFLKLAPLFCV